MTEKEKEEKKSDFCKNGHILNIIKYSTAK